MCFLYTISTFALVINYFTRPELSHFISIALKSQPCTMYLVYTHGPRIIGTFHKLQTQFFLVTITAKVECYSHQKKSILISQYVSFNFIIISYSTQSEESWFKIYLGYLVAQQLVRLPLVVALKYIMDAGL